MIEYENQKTKETKQDSMIAALILIATIAIGTSVLLSKLIPKKVNTVTAESSSSISVPVIDSSYESPKSSSDLDVNKNNDSSVYIKLTDKEIESLTEFVSLEAGDRSRDCWQAVASVVINRVTHSDDSLYAVIYADNQFATAGDMPENQDNKYAEIADVVKDVVIHGPVLPEYVTYYDRNSYSTWSDRLVPYCNIDGIYFSYDYVMKEADGYVD